MTVRGTMVRSEASASASASASVIYQSYISHMTHISATSTFIHFHPNFHPQSSTFIHFLPLSSIFIHFHPLSSTFIHFHPFSSTFIHFRPSSSFWDFFTVSGTHFWGAFFGTLCWDTFLGRFIC